MQSLLPEAAMLVVSQETRNHFVAQIRKDVVVEYKLSLVNWKPRFEVYYNKRCVHVEHDSQVYLELLEKLSEHSFQNKEIRLSEQQKEAERFFE